ncbi:MAG: dihydropteroate synthase [Chloroherpetonaceae bacterium]|nr:dihydropteroate synthase [Chloroherpetonaceae bacterium]
MIWNCRDYQVDLRNPIVMGILNITPDSFSDGGKFFRSGSDEGSYEIDVNQVLDIAHQMIQDGAQIIDVGGESTKPGAKPIDTKEELNRVLPVITALANEVSIPISVDTSKAEVAEKALIAGAAIVNDISGFRNDSQMSNVCFSYNAGVVLMHSTELPKEMKWSYEISQDAMNIISNVKSGLALSLTLAAQIEKNRIVLDPGFGFSKSTESNFRILKGLRSLSDLGFPLLIGLSRKSFLGSAISVKPFDIPPSERDYATTAAHFFALQQGVKIIRSHHVKAANDAIKVFRKLNEVTLT